MSYHKRLFGLFGVVAVAVTLGFVSPSAPSLADGSSSTPSNLVHYKLEPAGSFEQSAFWDFSTVFPPDSRTQVRDTTQAPFRSIALLQIRDQAGNPHGLCTGFFVSANALLTAAHCLYESAVAVGSVLVIPGAHPPMVAPFGTAAAESLFVPEGWRDREGKKPSSVLGKLSPYDYGLVILKGDPFQGKLAPYLEVVVIPDVLLRNPDLGLRMAGYPGDKPFATMWQGEALDLTYDAEFIYSTLDLFDGQSGAPLIGFDEVGDDYFVVGIASAGGPQTNAFVRITASLALSLKRACGTVCSMPIVGGGAVVTLTPTPVSTPTPPPTNTQLPFKVFAPLLRRD